MKSSKIGEMFVQFSVKGLEASKSAVAGTVAAISRGFSGVGTIIGSIASSAKNLGIVFGGIAGGAVATFGRAAMSGTVEGERLGASMEYLGRVVGGGLAPYVRILTSGIVSLADAYRSLTPSTKAVVTATVLAVAGIGAFIAVMPIVGAVIGAVISPIGLMIAGIAAIGTYLVSTGRITGTFSENVGKAMQFCVDAYLAGEKGVRKFFAVSSFVFQNLGSFARAVFDDLLQFIRFTFDEAVRIGGAMARNVRTMTERAISGNFAGITENLESLAFRPFESKNLNKFFDNPALKAKLAALDAEFEARGSKWGKVGERFASGLAMGIQRVTDAFNTGGAGPQLKLDVQFESMQGTWDRLQKAFAGGSAEDIARDQLGEQKKMNETLGQVLGAIRGAFVPAVGS
ncbi:hypothetical protein [Tuwongella immobilis]|uniref:Uncharacterized protein n=1 Tax=Tuwongella immobilis TaxID=692036 RepID=A0A6C2YPK9_9BACT|nr:hypothetical protein [Tuwongella immobilis]VIP03063.1 unnamed protein product [Tuwongella immobilis]VTS03276.1 unnamed protein product [Tuwongella immobilis]